VMRRGRWKDKGPVIEEDTIEEAIDVNVEPSGNEFENPINANEQGRSETEDRKQNTLLGRLRKKYATTILHSKCNMHRNTFRAESGHEVANVPVKTIKVPIGGK
ncbi:hypothetical protein Tco_0181625, partial [Tanacetum coccineum]